MSRDVRRFGVMWKRGDPYSDPPTSPWIETMLSDTHAGEWAVVPAGPQMHTRVHQEMPHGDFLAECLRHIPVQFYDDIGSQQTVIRYLASVQDLMSLLKEHVR